MKKNHRIVLAIMAATGLLTAAGCGDGGGGGKKADLTISKSPVGSFSQGQSTAVYAVTVSNPGEGSSSGLVTVTDQLPAGLTLQSMSGDGWDCDSAAAACSRADTLPPGESYPDISVAVNIARKAPASVVNTVTVAGGNDANLLNNSASHTTTIVPRTTDLTISKSHTGDFSQGQLDARYTVKVSNVGTLESDGLITVKEEAPAGLTVRNISGGDDWNCDFMTKTCTTDKVLAAGSGFDALDPITVSVDVAADADLTLTNKATVSGGDDANAANNTANDQTVIDVTAVAVSGGGNNPPFDANGDNPPLNAAIAFRVNVTSTYTYNIVNFKTGDSIEFLNCPGQNISLANSSGADKVIDIKCSNNDSGSVATVHLTGLNAADDALISGNCSFRNVFGASSLLPNTDICN